MAAWKLVHRLFLDGTSTFDAWLNASSVQLGQVILTLPYSFAQLGLVSGTIFQLVYAFMGWWSCYMTTSLYLSYRDQLSQQNKNLDDYVNSIQWHEVVGGLLGSRWKIAAFIFNTGYQFSTCVIIIVSCSSLGHALNSSIDKRTWTLVLGPCFLLLVLIPRAQHYRIWSCMGVTATTYTSWYLTIATIFHGQVKHVRHTGPVTNEQYFVGATNLLYAFGGHAVTIEITDAMKKPGRFKTIYGYSVLYNLTLTLPPAITVYWAFGDLMLNHSYAIDVLPQSRFRQTAVFLMLLHQLMRFGFISLPIFMAWEKLLGVHESGYYLRSAVRVPIVLFMWFIGIMVPFIGLIDSVVGGIFTTFSVYILPCAAYMMLHRTVFSLPKALTKRPLNWIGIYCMNLTVILWVFVAGVGFGGWSGVSNLIHKLHTVGLFPRCYQCKTNSTM